MSGLPMGAVPQTTNTTFNAEWNKEYDFTCSDNQRVIDATESYIIDQDNQAYQAGDKIDSPWGSNQVLEVSLEGSLEICLKEIIVNPKQMLSLQRHRGRAEKWNVHSGTLTAIIDGQLHEIEAGQSIDVPKASVHCMINTTDKPVKVIETQTGVNREADNIRLYDFTNRPTYPITTEIEALSVALYKDIMAEIKAS